MAATPVDQDQFVTEDENQTQPLPPEVPPPIHGAPSAGKYLLLEVPNFTNDASGDPNREMGSYLRLGVAAPNAGDRTLPRKTGEDLAGWVQGFADDTRDRGDGTESNVPAALTYDPASPANPDNVSSPASPNNPLVPGNPPAPNKDSTTPVTLDRRKESLWLHQKGGWRDHSDGNRITTTRGDKVEVIRGNYKLVVMGRSDDEGAQPGSGGLSQAQGWDISGGLYDGGESSFASTPDDGVSPDTRSQDDATGVGSRKQTDQQWMSVQYKWQQDTADGRWGWTQTTVTGSEFYSDGDAGNGRVVSKTWVDSMEQYLGSRAKRVASIIQDTYAHSVEQTTDADGEIHTTNNASGIYEHDHSGGTYTTTQTADGIINSYQGAPMVTNTLTTALYVDTTVSVHVQSEVGVHLDMHIGAHVDLHILEHMDIHLGFHHDMHVGHLHYELKSSGMEIDDDLGSTEFSNGEKIEVSNSIASHIFNMMVTRMYQQPVAEVYSGGITIFAAAGYIVM